jgi:hypothetical protein
MGLDRLGKVSVTNDTVFVGWFAIHIFKNTGPVYQITQTTASLITNAFQPRVKVQTKSRGTVSLSKLFLLLNPRSPFLSSNSLCSFFPPP